MLPARSVFILSALLVALLMVFLFSLATGAVSIPFTTIVNTLFGLDGEQQQFIINRSRLPRTLLALMTGASLGLAGVIVQAILRNPLASPKIIGINSGAAAAVLLGSMMFPALSLKWLPLFACFGGIFAAFIIYVLAEQRVATPARLAIIGIAVGFCADAVVDFVMVTADTYDISAPLIWLAGSLWSRGWPHVEAVWPLLTVLCAACLFMGFRLDLVVLGQAQAKSLGMNVRIERAFLLGIATFLASISISVVGVIGFVGLIAPHIARQLVGGSHKLVLPVVLLVGAILVVFADAVGRSIAPPIEVSAGILTALLGAPFFIYLLIRNKSEFGE